MLTQVKLNRRDKELLDKHLAVFSNWETYPSVTDEFRDGSFANAYHSLMTYTTRRFVHGEVREFVAAVAARNRLEWNTFARNRPRKRWPSCMWHWCLDGLAIKDVAFVQNFAQKTELHPEATYSDDPSRLLYEGLVSILNGKFDLTAIARLNQNMRKSYGSYISAIVNCFLAIGADDANGVAESIASINLSLRRTRSENPIDKMICLHGHGLYRLAEQLNPNLVKAFETSSPLPWDSELHGLVESIDDAATILSGFEIDGELAEEMVMIAPRPEGGPFRLNKESCNEGPACPDCNVPLRTAQAKQCFSCGANWH